MVSRVFLWRWKSTICSELKLLTQKCWVILKLSEHKSTNSYNLSYKLWAFLFLSFFFYNLNTNLKFFEKERSWLNGLIYFKNEKNIQYAVHLISLLNPFIFHFPLLELKGLLKTVLLISSSNNEEFELYRVKSKLKKFKLLNTLETLSQVNSIGRLFEL